MCKPIYITNDCSLQSYAYIDKHTGKVKQRCVINILHPLLFVLIVQFFYLSSAHALNLREVEQITQQKDFISKARQLRGDALGESAIADAQLPDPQLSLGLFNLPTDDFDINSEPNTQLRFGVSQSFPRGNTLTLKEKQTKWAGNAEYQLASDEVTKSIRSVREHYLNLYYQISAQTIIDESRQYFVQLVNIAESYYKVGRVNQQDLLRAQLELSRLDNRVIELKTKEDIARAELSKWLDDKAFEPIEKEYPTLPPLISQQEIIDSLAHHPSIQAEDAMVSFFDEGVAIAREQYKPGWSVGVEYRKRFGDNIDGSDREDQAAAMVKVDLPFFTDQRQDRRLAASQHQVSAAKYVRSDKLQSLRQAIFRDYANWTRLSEKNELYETRLVPEANANAHASLTAYQSGVTEFTTLARARITQLNIRLEALRAKTERSSAHARLLYLAQGVL
jgi:outer membrane protein TolC